MTELTVQNNDDKWYVKVWNFIKGIIGFKKISHKCACGSKCGSNCMCDGCILTIGYSEREDDGSEPDIYMTQEEIEIS